MNPLRISTHAHIQVAPAILSRRGVVILVESPRRIKFFKEKEKEKEKAFARLL